KKNLEEKEKTLKESPPISSIKESSNSVLIQESRENNKERD
ncbi:13394_t:CDS:1, partial [Racocetra fulgida]